MRLNDTLSGWLLLLFGVAVVLYAGTFPKMPGHGVGPGFFPMLVGAGIALCGAILVWTDRTQRDVEDSRFAGSVSGARRVLNGGLVVTALIFYALAVDTVGFFLTAFIFLVVLFLAFGVRRRWIAPIAAAVTIGLHGAFYSLLRVPLPWGWLEGMAW